MTKSFSLRVLLSVTTGRLLTEAKSPTDNGIDDLYEILELAYCSTDKALKSFDGWLSHDKSGGGEAIKMWLTELKNDFPQLKDNYEVPKIA